MINQRLKECLDLQSHKQDYYSEKFNFTDDKLSKILSGRQGLKSDDLEVIINTLELSPDEAYYLITGKKPEVVAKKDIVCSNCNILIEDLKRDKERLYTIIENILTLK